MTETEGQTGGQGGGPDRGQLAKVIAEAIPFSRALGITLTAAGPGMAQLSVPYRADLVGDPATGVLHGGVVTAALDSCCGSAVMLHPSRPAGTATMDLRIDYMRPSTPGATLHAKAECYRTTRHVAFVRGIAHEGDEADPVAVATGAFTIETGGMEGMLR